MTNIELDFLFDMAQDLEAAGETRNAAALYRSIVAADSTHYAAIVNLGSLRMEQGKLDKALRLYKLAVSNWPCDSVAWFNLGVCHHDMGDTDSAAWCYRKAIQFNPHDMSDARFNLAAIAK